ncbi:hypothetical protein CH63R_12753 [Colletotrichum higginsianum IMI 349063]|uniref:Uncharacterized protein n=1 Tax=Colletotrichum higginsianum (strain IMI 349063) TaxID=759273 RepID=A0A1B7XV46_COLHI|nr:hypothetical protein CH63R_12753 [Colletotrichum higginsianum IMI 349063]OBR03626.1 hypothetical protein CH63R_12753 [Colletotrichum higginsianum IMI 349063]GJD02025.1 hypothetical protein ColKHC_10850 [Colletotrichum higginsianum]
MPSRKRFRPLEQHRGRGRSQQEGGTCRPAALPHSVKKVPISSRGSELAKIDHPQVQIHLMTYATASQSQVVRPGRAAQGQGS